jgi:hypothetical protein
MIILLLMIAAFLVVFSLSKGLGDKLAAKYPILKKPLAFIGNALFAAVWLTFIGFGIYLQINPTPPPPPKPLPEKIQPPTLNGTTWTVYDRSSKDKSQFALDLISRQTKNNEVLVWERFDDFSKNETTLIFTRFDCEAGIQSDIYDVYYKNGTYTGYDEDKDDNEAKVDLGTVGGAGLVLACFDRMPEKIDRE